MAAAIREYDVMEALRPWLGTAIVQNTAVAREAATVLRRYSPYRQSLDELRDELESGLFHLLHKTLGVSMTVRLDDGNLRRILVKDLEPMTDDLMGVLFDSLSVYSVTYELLNAYALSHESLASLRVLYQKYSDMMSPPERSMILSIIQSVYPPDRYRRWLK